MTARRGKVKQPRLNQQLVPAEEQQPKKQGRWKGKLGDYLLDVSKYVLTAVVISSLFGNMEDYVFIYALGVITVVITLIVGLILTNNQKKE